MRQRAVVILLAGCLLGLTPQPAEAAVTRKWGQVLDSYGARLFACKMPERTDIGTRWRIHVRAVNRSPVTVRVSVLVRRWVVRQGETITKQAWARDLAPGASTPVGAVRAYDQRVGEGRFFDYLDFRVRRNNDAQVLQWQSMYPTGVPRCDLPASAISWQGSGYVSQNGGRMQVCGNMLLDADGPTMFWRFRGDATHTDQTLHYNAEVVRVEDWFKRASWTRTIPPGGYTEAGSMEQSMGFVNSHSEEYFGVSVEHTSTGASAWYGEARNVC